MTFVHGRGWLLWPVLLAATVHLAGGATIGINNFRFDPAQDLPLLGQLSASPIPLRMTFYWHDVESAPGYNDRQVAEATQAGVPILGVLGYSAPDQSSIPADFDFTEISPFNISWHNASGPLDWGAADGGGAAGFLWQAMLE